MPSTSWKDDRGDGRPAKFGRKAKAWLRRALRRSLFGPADNEGMCVCRADKGEPKWHETVVATLLDWYLDRSQRYVEWVDEDQFRGDGFSNGYWALSETATKDFRAACDAVDRQLDERETLDDWLKDDIADKLWYRGDPGGMPSVSADILERLKQRKRARRCVCGVKFVADRHNARKCDACRNLARVEREARRAERRGRR